MSEGDAAVVRGTQGVGEYLEIVFFQAVDDQVGQEQVLEDAAGEGDRVAAGAFTAEDAAGDNQVRQPPPNKSQCMPPQAVHN